MITDLSTCNDDSDAKAYFKFTHVNAHTHYVRCIILLLQSAVHCKQIINLSRSVFCEKIAKIVSNFNGIALYLTLR